MDVVEEDDDGSSRVDSFFASQREKERQREREKDRERGNSEAVDLEQ